MKKNPGKIYVIFFIIWVVLWVNFIARNLTRKKYFENYKTLYSRDADGKRSYAYGPYLYEFLKFCKSSLPERSTYDIIGMIEASIDQRRSVYYLYPAMRAGKADYLLVFDKPGHVEPGYELFKKLDEGRFILKRR